MSKNILFVNASPNKNGNTARMVKKLLKDRPYKQLDLVDYKLYALGQDFPDDQFAEIYQEMCKADLLVMGTPVYWYSMAAPLRALLDRLYSIVDNNDLGGKDLYFVIQGAAPSKETLSLCNYTMERFCTLYHMNYKGMTSN